MNMRAANRTAFLLLLNEPLLRGGANRQCNVPTPPPLTGLGLPVELDERLLAGHPRCAALRRQHLIAQALHGGKIIRGGVRLGIRLGLGEVRDGLLGVVRVGRGVEPILRALDRRHQRVRRLHTGEELIRRQRQRAAGGELWPQANASRAKMLDNP